ncbi:sedoheptulokinase [Lingula anatina]|uniref:Sedoheptulokinase n=1 Tax=Lingula anatina TaxID=7574 RepID=A0A1S3J6G0_LINAN|nr:sedoheptulokinase [Lingula anatina]|eukprot:XP_013405429.1 sedoheptulokinase [Lingula anatina]
MALSSERRYVLGLDLGTTTVKAAIVDCATNEVVAASSADTQASVSSRDNGPLANEQDPKKIITALQYMVSRLPRDKLSHVLKIGISGQMHGVMFWKRGKAWSKNPFGRFEVESTSNLTTWQDCRCTPEFLETLPRHDSHLRLSTGYGCATIFWYKKNHPELLDKYDCAGTIQDFFVATLCELSKPVMSTQNAASWGYFSTIANSWNTDILSRAQFPVHILPEVRPPGSIAGHLSSDWYGLAKGTPVSVAMGDLQCSILSGIQQEHDAVLNISTSAQVAFAMPKGFTPPPCDLKSPIEYFPYFSDTYIAVAASLTGGNVMAAFVKMLQQWTHELGHAVPDTKVWATLLEQGEEEESTDLVISPTIYGERHMPNQHATVSNINTSNLSLGSVTLALCQGVVTNLHTMMPRDFLLGAGVKRIVGSGAALTKNKVIQREIEKLYSLPVTYVQGTDSAIGAAIAMI